MNYLVSYDLHNPGQDYEKVHKAIVNASNGTWCKPLESVYIIRSNFSAAEIYNRIAKQMDSNDQFLVINVGQDFSWYLEKDVSAFLQKML